MKRIRYFALLICTIICLSIPIYTTGENQEAYEAKTQITEVQTAEENDSVEIQEEEVPLGLDSMASFERYKRDVAVLLVFISMMVTITIGVHIKESYDRERLN